MSCGIGRRYSLDPALLWLQRRPAAVAQIWPVAWELPCAVGAALKKQKKKKKIPHPTPIIAVRLMLYGLFFGNPPPCCWLNPELVVVELHKEKMRPLAWKSGDENQLYIVGLTRAESAELISSLKVNRAVCGRTSLWDCIVYKVQKASEFRMSNNCFRI